MVVQTARKMRQRSGARLREESPSAPDWRGEAGSRPGHSTGKAAISSHRPEPWHQARPAAEGAICMSSELQSHL